MGSLSPEPIFLEKITCTLNFNTIMPPWAPGNFFPNCAVWKCGDNKLPAIRLHTKCTVIHSDEGWTEFSFSPLCASFCCLLWHLQGSHRMPLSLVCRYLIWDEQVVFVCLLVYFISGKVTQHSEIALSLTCPGPIGHGRKVRVDIKTLGRQRLQIQTPGSHCREIAVEEKARKLYLSSQH